MSSVSENNEAKWYVLCVKSNKEGQVGRAIASQTKLCGKEDEIQEVFIPTEKVSSVKGGKKRVLNKKYFPGYVLIKMVMNEENWYFLKTIPGVSRLMGGNAQPVAIQTSQVDHLKRDVEDQGEAPKPVMDVKVGDKVLITEGLFVNISGEVREVNSEKGVVSVEISIFGRKTPVWHEHSQIKKEM